MACSLSHTDDEVEALVQKLTDEDMLHQLHLYEEALRETLEEQAIDEKEREKKYRQKQAEGEEFVLEFELSSSTRVEPSLSTPNSVRIISGPAGIVQQAKLLKERDILLGWDGAVMSTQEYMKKVVEDVGDDEDFKSGPKLEQVVAIVKSCSPNAIVDLTMTMKDLSEVAMILANISVFTP
nr:hypothetical protein [Tanacetum cinerariifolium]